MMPENNSLLRLRPFTFYDQAAARALILAGLGEHFGFIDESLNPDLDDIWQSYVQPGHLFLVAELDDCLVGTGALIQETPDTGRIVRLSVSQAQRRAGIGRALLEHLLQAGRERGYRQIVVETNHDWHDAIGLYRRCGFVEYGRDEESVYLCFRQ